MSVWETVKYWFGRTGGEVYDVSTDYDIKNIGTLVLPEKLSDKNAYTLACAVAEIYFPVDFYADRISKLRFYIANKQGKEIASSELSRLISNDINPLFTFSDLVYQYVFSLLGDGNAINYLTVPSTYSTIAPSTIQRWDVLAPNQVTLQEYNNLSTLNVKSLSEIVKRITYDEHGIRTQELPVDRVVIHNYSTRRKQNSMVLAKSPLWGANKSIDTLLAVYSARYNVYANNGAAGYLAKKVSGNRNTQFEEAIMDGNRRQDILDDINNRNGVTGRRNIWGISGVPIEFVKTLATISELLPFEETLEDSIKIAGLFQIPAVLVPRKDQSTFSNQQTAEVTVWENGLLAMATTVCENLAKMFRFPSNTTIRFDTSNVSALKENEMQQEQLNTIKMQNYGTLYKDGIIKYNEMLTALGLPTVENGDRYVYEMTVTPYAVRLGVGGTQALKEVLADQAILPETKKVILEVVFGMTEQESSKITGI